MYPALEWVVGDPLVLKRRWGRWARIAGRLALPAGFLLMAGMSLAYAQTGFPNGSGGGGATVTFTVGTASSHTAGDVVGPTAAVLTFPLVCPKALNRTILASASLRYDIAAVTSGMTSFRLHLYRETPPSALADDAVWDLPAGDRAAYAGYVDLGSPVDLGATLYVEANGIQKEIRCGSTMNLFGYLVTNGTYITGLDSATIELGMIAP